METFKPPLSKNDILKRSTEGVASLMMSQFLTKAVTFIFNNLLIRILSPKIFGITTLLDFIRSTVLFFSRDAIRLTSLRVKSLYIDKDNSKESSSENNNHNISSELQTVINFSYIPIMIGLPLSSVFIIWQYSSLSNLLTSTPYLLTSMTLIWCSIILELLSEPFFIINQFMLNYKTRTKFENISITVSCLIQFVIVYSCENTGISDMKNMHEGIPIFAFALGNFIQSLLLLIFYCCDYLQNLSRVQTISILPLQIRNIDTGINFYFQETLMNHFKKVYFQLCFKHLLTEGDKLVINSLCTIEEQGIYSVLSNYGSLIARLVFSPIEESLRLFLTTLLSITSTENLKLSIEVIINLVKFYLYLALLIIGFGPINSSYMLQFVIGSKWNKGILLNATKIYCLYLPFLSINGIFEAFFQSLASANEIIFQSYLMILFSGIFFASSWILIVYCNLSLSGLILGNIINMVFRIIYAGWFIQKFYRTMAMDIVMLNTYSFNFNHVKSVAFVTFWITTGNWLFIGSVNSFKQFFINIILGLLLLLLICHKEQKLIKTFIASNHFIGSNKM